MHEILSHRDRHRNHFALEGIHPSTRWSVDLKRVSIDVVQIAENRNTWKRLQENTSSNGRN